MTIDITRIASALDGIDDDAFDQEHLQTIRESLHRIAGNDDEDINASLASINVGVRRIAFALEAIARHLLPNFWTEFEIEDRLFRERMKREDDAKRIAELKKE